MKEKVKTEMTLASMKHGELTGTLERKLFVLWEEVGECIQANNDIHETGKGYVHLQTELAQVAGVAIRFGETIEDEAIEEKDKQIDIFS